MDWLGTCIILSVSMGIRYKKRNLYFIKLNLIKNKFSFIFYYIKLIKIYIYILYFLIILFNNFILF